jgi:hypothetical protein
MYEPRRARSEAWREFSAGSKIRERRESHQLQQPFSDQSNFGRPITFFFDTVDPKVSEAGLVSEFGGAPPDNSQVDPLSTSEAVELLRIFRGIADYRAATKLLELTRVLVALHPRS